MLCIQCTLAPSRSPLASLRKAAASPKRTARARTSRAVQANLGGVHDSPFNNKASVVMYATGAGMLALPIAVLIAAMLSSAFMNTDAFHPRARSDPVAEVVRSPAPVDAGPIDAEPDS